MKSMMILFLVTIVVCRPVQALSGPGLPTSVCSNGYYQCDEKAKRMWSLFQDAQAVPLQNTLVAGRCSFNGVTDGTVSVLLGLSSNSTRTYFDALIGFYKDLTDYQNLPSSAVSEVFPKIYRDRNLVIRAQQYDYIEYTDNLVTRYWIRYHPVKNSLVMMGYFGFNTILCEFPIIDA